jgi:hypothetical protein
MHVCCGRINFSASTPSNRRSVAIVKMKLGREARRTSHVYQVPKFVKAPGDLSPLASERPGATAAISVAPVNKSC